MLRQGAEQHLFAPEVVADKENPKPSNQVRPIGLRIGIIRPAVCPLVERARNLVDEPVVGSVRVYDLHHDPGAGVTTPAAPGPLGSAAAETRPPDQWRTA